MWMEKQVARCLERGDEDMTDGYQKKAWEPYERRVFYEKGGKNT